MKIGGSAEKILKLRDLSELKDSLPLPVRLLGNGSNILIDDRGLKGTVILVRDFPPSEPAVLEEDEQSVTLKVSAGVFLPSLSRWCSKRGLSGCEYMVGVPGTLGGAIVQNAGANDQDISQILISVEFFDIEKQKHHLWSHDKCELSYRHSKFKELTEKKEMLPLVVSADLKLLKKPTEEIESQIEKNLNYRKEKTPYSKPSLGSVFTRLPGSATGEWIYPGKLIEDAGLKGFQIGGAQVSSVHANYIVNTGNATFKDVISVIEHIEEKVLEHSGHQLKREILVWSDSNAAS
jgi:UDP-N-acetylmuramate dehydrogenase